MFRTYIGFAVFLILTSLGIFGCRTESSSAPKIVSDTLASIESQEIPKLFKNSNGLPTVVNLWATWCQPCREEFPELVKFQREWSSKGVKLIFISADFESEVAEVQKFLKDQKVDFLTYLKKGSEEKFMEAVDKDWSGSLPSTFIFDADGKILKRWESKVKFSTLDAEVKNIVESIKTKKNKTTPVKGNSK